MGKIDSTGAAILWFDKMQNRFLIVAIMTFFVSCGSSKSNHTPTPTASPSLCSDSLNANLLSAIYSFVPTPSSLNGCSSDSDCNFIPDTVSRDGHYCGGGCGLVATSSYAAQFSSFLNSDPNVTVACDAIIQSNCEVQPIPCPYLQPTCTAGNCK